MIGGPPIGAGPIVRPFYNRAAVGGGGGTPLARTALGTVQDTFPGTSQLVLSGVTVPINALVVAGVLFSDFSGIGEVPVMWGSDSAMFTRDTFLVTALSGYYIGIWSFPTGAAARAGDDIILDFQAGLGDTPEWTCMWACYCLGVLGAAYQDRVQGATGVSSDQDSGLTVLATTQAKEFVVGCIGTNGTGGDTIGTWQSGLSAGQNIGNGGSQIKEGFLLANAIAQQRSRVTGATNAEFVSLVQTYKGT